MKKIEQTVETKNSIDLQMEVSMEGETIIKRQADSLVGNFMRMLYTMMVDISGDSDGKRMLTRERVRSQTVDSVDFTSSAYIDLSNDVNWQSGELVYLDTNYQAMNGFYYMVGDYNLEVYEVTFDRSTGDITQGNRTDWSSLDSSKFDGNVDLVKFEFTSPNRSDYFFNNANIIVGENNPSTSADIEDQWLENINRKIDRTGTTITEPAVQTNSSEITLSRQFTNNENYDVTVGEIGVITRCNDNNNYVLIARDNVTDFTIAQGNSVTIEYKLTLDNSGDGGMMSQFHQLLYRHLRGTNRTVRDIFNNDQSDNRDEGTMVPISIGGISEPSPWDNGLEGEYVGPIPGTGTTTVANTNTSLESRVPHGTSDGTMVHYGTVGKQIVLNEANGEIYFDVVKPLENQGSTTITIQEQALYSAYYRGRENQYPYYSVMIARHTLNNSVNVAPGEILKVSYRLKLTV